MKTNTGLLWGKEIYYWTAACAAVPGAMSSVGETTKCISPDELREDVSSLRWSDSYIGEKEDLLGTYESLS